MTYRDYFEQHPTENIGWCKCFADKSSNHFLVMCNGESVSVSSNNQTYHRSTGTLTANTMEAFAMAVNNGYYCYRGWTDESIALDVMSEIGCSSCPFRNKCDAMNEEMG